MDPGFMQFLKWKTIMGLSTVKVLMSIPLIGSKELFSMIHGYGETTIYVMNLFANKITITFSVESTMVIIKIYLK